MKVILFLKQTTRQQNKFSSHCLCRIKFCPLESPRLLMQTAFGSEDARAASLSWVGSLIVASNCCVVARGQSKVQCQVEALDTGLSCLMINLALYIYFSRKTHPQIKTLGWNEVVGLVSKAQTFRRGFWFWVALILGKTVWDSGSFKLGTSKLSYPKPVAISRIFGLTNVSGFVSSLN